MDPAYRQASASLIARAKGSPTLTDTAGNSTFDSIGRGSVGAIWGVF